MSLSALMSAPWCLYKRFFMWPVNGVKRRRLKRGGKIKEWQREGRRERGESQNGEYEGVKKKKKKEQARDSSVMVSHAWPSIFNEAKVNVFSCSFTHRTNPNHAQVNLFKQNSPTTITTTHSTAPSPLPGPALLSRLPSSAVHLHSLSESPASFHRNPTLTESDSCHQTEKRNLAFTLIQLCPPLRPSDPLLSTHIIKRRETF